MAGKVPRNSLMTMLYHVPVHDSRLDSRLSPFYPWATLVASGELILHLSKQVLKGCYLCLIFHLLAFPVLFITPARGNGFLYLLLLLVFCIYHGVVCRIPIFLQLPGLSRIFCGIMLTVHPRVFYG